MSTQPDKEALNGQRVRAKFIDLIALGRAVEDCERQAIPLDHDTLHRKAREWKARPMTDTEKWVLERICRPSVDPGDIISRAEQPDHHCKETP